jgi:hypothetical protein
MLKCYGVDKTTRKQANTGTQSLLCLRVSELMQHELMHVLRSQAKIANNNSTFVTFLLTLFDVYQKKPVWGKIKKYLRSKMK